MVPFLPGPPLIVAGALVYAFATDWSPVGPGRLVILAALATAAYVLAHVAAALGARRSGASAWGVAGALVGAVVGVFFGPLGLVFGPMAGAITGELLRGQDVEGSVRSGLGALVGMAVGVVANLGLALVMIGLFLWWVWRST